MAGNGRGMARKTAKENPERSQKATGTRRAAAKAGTPSTSRTKTSAGKEAEEKKDAAKKTSRRKSAKPGAELLEVAADAVVKEQCTELANGLAAAARKGNASCAKMLVTLAERIRIQKEGANAKETRSAANLLASEPDWREVPEGNSQADCCANNTATE
jgi:hypothetical protein